MKLSLIKLNRNRLENKGAIAFSKVFSQMKSLEHVEIFQNGIKEEGMIEVIKSFNDNRNLKVIKINDNWIKSGAKIFSEIIPNLSHLKILDISDLKIGNSNAILIFKSLSLLNEIEEIYSNYNETEKKKAQEEIFNILLQIQSLKVVEIKGNMINRKLYNKFKKEFDKAKIDCYSSEEEDLNEEEEEEEEDEKEIKKEEIKKEEVKKEEIKKEEIKKEEIKKEEVKKEEVNEEDITDEITKKMDNLDIHK